MLLNILLISAFSFLTTYFTIPILIKFANQVKLYANPNERASHTNNIPSLGGIAIFLGMTLAILLITPNQSFGQIQFLLAAQFLIFFLGLKDDIFILSARKKLLVQIMCAIILMSLGDIKITSFYNVLGVEKLTEPQSLIFSTIVIVGLINAFNLIDGINWLAGLICISAGAFLSFWFYFNNFPVEAGITFSLIGATLAFLIYNKTPAKIFMGDTGSLLIGLTIAFLLIRFINLNYTHPGLKLPLRSAPSMAISLMFIPILDTLRVLLIRIKNRKSPFSPDRNHLHHLLIDAGFSHIKSSLILFSLNSMAIVGSFLLNHFTGRIVIPLLFLVGYAAINLFALGRVRRWEERRKKGAKIYLTKS